MRSTCFVGVGLLCLAACQTAPPVSHGTGGLPLSTRKSPLSQAELRTTDPAIAWGNLQAQIDGELRLGTFRALTVTQRAGIIDLIIARGQFLGRIADYERGAELADELVKNAPNDGEAYLARAKARATFHRFPEALADIEHAERLGDVRSSSIQSQRAAILQATGRYDEALAIRQFAATVRPHITSLGAEASLRGERGEIADAESLFAEAQYHYRDVSPLPLAWLYFQQGLMWMREANLPRARQLFEAAHDRLPMYAAAQGHLAEVEAALGNRDRAIALLRPLAQRADDPDYAAQLARILAAAGQAEEAGRWRRVAAARYDELIQLHPEAFADHAAEFWLAAGADPAKAITLARMNLQVRRTPRAYQLLVQAALAAHQPAVACNVADEARAVPQLWPSLRDVTAQAAAACALPSQAS